MTFWTPALSQENSLIMGAAVVGLVAATYQLGAGSVSSVHASDAYHPANDVSIKKSGWTALAEVAALTLLARDPNIAILGGAAIIVFHAHFRHAHVTNPGTGKMESPGTTAYTPAQYTAAADAQGSV